jgi:long-chain acyl-CoA synthetase
MTQIPQRLLGEALLFSTRNTPSKIAIISKQKEYSYSDICERSIRLASHLVSSGINRGDRVALYLNNSWQSIVSIYGVTLAGGVFIVINPQTKANKLKYILEDSEAKALISSNVFKNELHQALAETSCIQQLLLIDEGDYFKQFSFKTLYFNNITESGEIGTKLPSVIANDLAALIYTSGSTGFPKGVMMTHQSMVFTTWSLIEYLRLSEEDRILLVLPLAFDYGLYQLIMAITIGGTLIVEQSFAFPASIYKSIDRYKPTVFPGVPTLYAMMINTNKQVGLMFDSIKKVTNTAAALPAEFLPEMKKIFPNALIFKMYGLTECKRVCYLEPELVDLKPDSVGKAIPGTEVFLLSPEGKPVPSGEAGILHIRGPHVMSGYWNKEDLSKEMLKQGKIPGERILCSNDLFTLDEDGFLYFQGRTDDIIKTRGEKVSPLEIEKTIYKIDGIKEVAVIGVPDSILGESIAAFVTLYPHCDINREIILKECLMNLEPFMIPQNIFFLEQMPKSSNGKFDKFELKKLVANEY